VIPRWIKPLLLLAGVAALAVGLRLLSGNHLALFAVRHGPAGISLFILAAAAACAFGLPRQLVASAASASYGLWAGVAIALMAQILGCATDFLWARFIASDWAQRRISGRAARINQFLTAHPGSATLMLRLFPLGNNLALNLLAGVSTMRALPFLTASLLGYVPQTLVFALVGTGRTVHLSLGAALFAVSSLLGLWLAKRHQELRTDQAD
jgi:uncharacterized membrane protein YdjX (TVP38/TMEM64 family)